MFSRHHFNRLLVAWLFSLVSATTVAQNTDSLLRIFEKMPEGFESAQEDTTECGILYILARKNVAPDELGRYVARLKKGTERKMRELPANHPLQPTLKKYLAFTYNHMGLEDRDKGNVIAALGYFHRSLAIYEDIGLLSWIGITYNNMANTYNDIGDLDKAIEYMEKGLALLIKNGDKEEIAISTVNLGYFNFLKNKPAVALDYYNKGLKIAIENNDSYTQALALDRIGVIYSREGRYGEAMTCYQNSLRLGEEFKHVKVVATTLNDIGDCYSLQNSYKKALEYSTRALKISKELGNTIRIRNAAMSLKEIYSHLGNMREALAMYELYIQMRDSTNNEMTHKLSLKKQMEFEFEKKEIILKQEKERLEKLYEQKKKFYTLLGAILIIMFVIVMLSLYFWYRYKKEKESKNLHIELKEQLKQEIKEKESIANSIIHIQEQERGKLAAELHDGVNQLLFAAKMQLMAAGSTKEPMHEEGVKLIETAIMEIRSIASNQGSFLLKDKLLSDALTDLVQRLNGNKNMELLFLDYGLDESGLLDNQKINLLRIIQELLNNCIKHSGARNCYISVKTAKNKVQFAVTDNGMGMGESGTHRFGNGLKNINNKVVLMKGRIRTFSVPGKGTKVYIEIPIT